MKPLKFQAGVVFGQETDSHDLADIPMAMIMAAKFMEEAVLDRYGLSITCWAGQNAKKTSYCLKLFENTGKIPETDEDLNKLWSDLAETAHNMRRHAAHESAVSFDTEEGLLAVSAPGYCLDLLASISDTHNWEWRDVKVCFDRGYSYCLKDIAQIASLSEPQDPKRAPAFHLH